MVTPRQRSRPHRIRSIASITTTRYNHNAIELHAATAVWHEGKLTVYDATRFVRGFADSLAKMFSLDKDDVRVISPFVGGGFGGKGSMWPHIQLCVLAAKVVGRPVKLVLSREGVFNIVGGRTPSEQRVALAANDDGKLTSLIHTGVTATSFANDFAEQFSFPARHLYASENLLINQKVLNLNTTANTFMRAPGESIGTFALESAMDELSYELGLDPVELRLRNDPKRDPAKGIPFSSRHMKEAYQLGAEKFGWRDRAANVRHPRRRLVDRAGSGNRVLSGLSLSGVRARPALCRWYSRGAVRRAGDGNGHGHGADPACGRAPRSADGE